MHACIHTYMHAYIHTYTLTFIHTSTGISCRRIRHIRRTPPYYIHPYMHAYIHTYMHAYLHTYTCMHAYIHACMHTYIHTHLHSYIQVPAFCGAIYKLPPLAIRMHIIRIIRHIRTICTRSSWHPIQTVIRIRIIRIIRHIRTIYCGTLYKLLPLAACPANSFSYTHTHYTYHTSLSYYTYHTAYTYYMYA